MIYTTLSDIRAHRPCEDGWKKLLAHLGKKRADKQPLSFETILDSNGLDDALWCLRALPREMDGAVRLLACDFAEPAMKYTTDPRPAEAIRVARLHARGEVTDEELAAAWAAAGDAAWAAAGAAAGDAAREAAWAAAGDAAGAAAWAAAREAAWAAAGDAQEVAFREWLRATEMPAN